MTDEGGCEEKQNNLHILSSAVDIRALLVIWLTFFLIARLNNLRKVLSFLF